MLCILQSYFCFDTLNIALNLLLVQSKWLGWSHNDADCRQLTWDDKMAPNLDKVQVLRCRWLILVNIIMFEITNIFGRTSTNILDKQRNKWRIWPNTFICRSVYISEKYFSHKILTILLQISSNILR